MSDVLSKLIKNIRRFFKNKKSLKSKGYFKLISPEEQRWLDEYTARSTELSARIGIPYYD